MMDCPGAQTSLRGLRKVDYCARNNQADENRLS